MNAITTITTHITSRVARLLVAAVLAALIGLGTLLVPVGDAAAQTTDETAAINTRPTEVDDFEWISGQSRWANANASRLERTVFQFVPDTGEFFMIQPDGYPTLAGTYIVDDDVVEVQASYDTTTGYTGSTHVEMAGQMVVQDDELVLQLHYVAGGTIAAVINGSEFGSSSAKAYMATVTLDEV